jgi:hypothetical protein
MSIVTDTWRQLVRRRLWPVALLLVAALAAVPLLLAKDPEPAAVTAAPAGGAESARLLASGPIVSVASEEEGGKRRRVLGVRHDIFKPTAKAPKKAAQAESPAAAAAPAAAAGGGAAAAPAPGTTAPTPAPAAPAAPAKTWPADSLTVRFGVATQDRAERTLKPLRALGDAGKALLVYEGLKRDGKTAVFLLVADLEATGDGTCKGEDGACERLELKVGKDGATQFLDVLDADGEVVTQYQLDVLEVHNPSGKGVATAASRRGTLTAHVAVTGALGLR